MQTLQQLRRRIDSARDLQSVIKVMKALAAVAMRQYERAATSLSDYDRTVTQGLQVLLRGVASAPDTDQDQPAHQRSHIFVVFGSDHGMCSQLNDDIAEYLQQHFSPSHHALILVSGTRLANLVEHTDAHLWAQFSMPTSIEGVADAAAQLLESIQTARSQGEHHDVSFVFHRCTSSASYGVHTCRILLQDNHRPQPLTDTSQPDSPGPTTSKNHHDTLAAFQNEHIFVALYRAFVDTLACEHASRMSSMQSAERRIEHRVHKLETKYRRQRQASITQELMDTASGYEVLTNKDDRSS